MAVGTRLDAGALGLDGRVNMTGFTQRYVADRYLTRSRRCGDCAYSESCQGVHINFVRAHGYAPLAPVDVKLRSRRLDTAV
jgi:hypothetical protein